MGLVTNSFAKRAWKKVGNEAIAFETQDAPQREVAVDQAGVLFRSVVGQLARGVKKEKIVVGVVLYFLQYLRIGDLTVASEGGEGRGYCSGKSARSGEPQHGLDGRYSLKENKEEREIFAVADRILAKIVAPALLKSPLPPSLASMAGRQVRVAKLRTEGDSVLCARAQDAASAVHAASPTSTSLTPPAPSSHSSPSSARPEPAPLAGAVPLSSAASTSIALLGLATAQSASHTPPPFPAAPNLHDQRLALSTSLPPVAFSPPVAPAPAPSSPNSLTPACADPAGTSVSPRAVPQSSRNTATAAATPHLASEREIRGLARFLGAKAGGAASLQGTAATFWAHMIEGDQLFLFDEAVVVLNQITFTASGAVAEGTWIRKVWVQIRRDVRKDVVVWFDTEIKAKAAALPPHLSLRAALFTDGDALLSSFGSDAEIDSAVDIATLITHGIVDDFTPTPARKSTPAVPSPLIASNKPSVLFPLISERGVAFSPHAPYISLVRVVAAVGGASSWSGEDAARCVTVVRSRAPGTAKLRRIVLDAVHEDLGIGTAGQPDEDPVWRTVWKGLGLLPSEGTTLPPWESKYQAQVGSSLPGDPFGERPPLVNEWKETDFTPQGNDQLFHSTLNYIYAQLSPSADFSTALSAPSSSNESDLPSAKTRDGPISSAPSPALLRLQPLRDALVLAAPSRPTTGGRAKERERFPPAHPADEMQLDAETGAAELVEGNAGQGLPAADRAVDAEEWGAEPGRGNDQGEGDADEVKGEEDVYDEDDDDEDEAEEGEPAHASRRKIDSSRRNVEEHNRKQRERRDQLLVELNESIKSLALQTPFKEHFRGPPLEIKVVDKRVMGSFRLITKLQFGSTTVGSSTQHLRELKRWFAEGLFEELLVEKNEIKAEDTIAANAKRSQFAQMIAAIGDQYGIKVQPASIRYLERADQLIQLGATSSPVVGENLDLFLLGRTPLQKPTTALPYYTFLWLAYFTSSASPLPSLATSGLQGSDVKQAILELRSQFDFLPAPDAYSLVYLRRAARDFGLRLAGRLAGKEKRGGEGTGRSVANRLNSG
ncbi:hypothetical protein JCM10213v2_008818 [Rhodosporidiobolus nylandii]